MPWEFLAGARHDVRADGTWQLGGRAHASGRELLELGGSRRAVRSHSWATTTRTSPTGGVGVPGLDGRDTVAFARSIADHLWRPHERSTSGSWRGGVTDLHASSRTRRADYSSASAATTTAPSRSRRAPGTRPVSASAAAAMCGGVPGPVTTATGTPIARSSRRDGDQLDWPA